MAAYARYVPIRADWLMTGLQNHGTTSIAVFPFVLALSDDIRSREEAMS